MKNSTPRVYILFGVLVTLLVLHFHFPEIRVLPNVWNDSHGKDDEDQLKTIKDLQQRTEDTTTLKIPKKKKQKKTIGLALAGGSFPAGTVGAGIMRGFQRKTILIDGEERPAMEGFDFTTAISGGNFANVMYAYASDTTSDELLDTDGIGHPSEITTEELETIPDSSLFSTFIDPVNTTMAYSLFMTLLFRQDFWENFLFMRFLQPFGNSRFQSIAETRYDVKATPLVMTSLAGPAEIFPAYIENEMSRKFLSVYDEKIKSGELVPSKQTVESFNLGQLGFFEFPNLKETNDGVWDMVELSSFQIPYGAYITPDKVTIPIKEHLATYDDIGNMTAEPIDFVPSESYPNDVVPKEWGTPFTIPKLFAAGTNLLTIIGYMIPDALDPLLAWPNFIQVPTADGTKREMPLVDGGYNDSNGVPGLVKEGVKKIICNFYQTDIIDKEATFGGSQTYLAALPQIARYFGIFIHYNFLPPHLWITMPTGHLFDLYSNNENQMEKFFKIAESLYNAGEPVIVTLNDLDVVENKFWGIEGGGKVDLTVILNLGVPTKFSDQVPYDAAPPPEGLNVTDKYGFFTNPELSNVPNLASSRGNVVIDLPLLNFTRTLPLRDFNLGTKETRMTEILSSWMIEHAWDGLVGDDGEVKFKGFRKIFEED